MLQIPNEAIVKYLKFMLSTNNITKEQRKRFRKGLVNYEIYNRKQNGIYPYIHKNLELHVKINKKYSIGFKVVHSFPGILKQIENVKSNTYEKLDSKKLENRFKDLL